MLSTLFNYKAENIRVIDGDTIDADIDLGFGVWARAQRFRLKGVDAPEIKGASRADGLKVKDTLERLLKGRTVILKSEKVVKDVYGRYVADIYFSAGIKPQENEELKSVSAFLLDRKMVKELIM